MISKTLRLTATRATLIKLAIQEKIEDFKLNLSNEEYIQALKIISICDECNLYNIQNNELSITDVSNKV